MKASNDLEEAVAEYGGESLVPAQMRERLASAEQERDRLKLEVIQLDEILEENNQLRRALQYQEKSPLSLVAARIISRKPAQWYSTVVIDKGSDDGGRGRLPRDRPDRRGGGARRQDLEVIGPKSSVVLLLTDEMCQVSAKLQNSHEQGILSGQRGRPPRRAESATALPAEGSRGRSGLAGLQLGHGGVVPAPTSYLGEVVKLQIGVIDAEATVRPAVDFEDLVDLFVILRPHRPRLRRAGSPRRRFPSGGSRGGRAEGGRDAEGGDPREAQVGAMRFFIVLGFLLLLSFIVQEFLPFRVGLRIAPSPRPCRVPGGCGGRSLPGDAGHGTGWGIFLGTPVTTSRSTPTRPPSPS